MRHIVAVLIVFSLAGCVGSPIPEAINPDAASTMVGNGILEGSVLDESFVPIQAARVTLVGTEHEVETSWNGHFRFTNLKPALYRINVEAVGWSVATIDGRVQADFATRLTIFLDPVSDLGGYSTLEQPRGELTCTDVEGPGTQGVSCELEYHQTAFQADWAAVVIEVDWGESGFSSSSLAELTAEDRQKQLVFADLVAERPARIVLLPSTLHDGIGGKDPTPPEGERATLDIGIKKDPARAASTIGAGATFQEDYKMYITTFYNEVPEDLADYSALPE